MESSGDGPAQVEQAERSNGTGIVREAGKIVGAITLIEQPFAEAKGELARLGWTFRYRKPRPEADGRGVTR